MMAEGVIQSDRNPHWFVHSAIPGSDSALSRKFVQHIFFAHNGKFGLVRHYSWRTPLCSKKCVDRFRARRESDRNWVGWLQTAFDQLPEDRARAL
jgi:hypothetical protein